MTGAEQANLWKELRQIHRRLEVLEDAVLSPDDREALKAARREFKEGKTVGHKEVVKKLL